MLLGAAIGAVVGLTIYFIQQQNLKKKQNAETLDSNVTDVTAELEEQEEKMEA